MEDLTGLGRLYSPDPRDKEYLLPRKAAATMPNYRYWGSPGVLDQGGTSECVAYAGVKYLEGAPVYNKWSKSGYRSITELYKECQRNDEWPGEDYDGTSVRALMKVLKAKGYISEYRWAFSLGPVVDHLLTKGPVIMGTDWHMDMFMTDRHGYISATGENAGGHAWKLLGGNKTYKNPDGTRGRGRMIQSWGPGWGDKGRAWITFEDIEKLIAANGEAAVATEILRP